MVNRGPGMVFRFACSVVLLALVLAFVTAVPAGAQVAQSPPPLKSSRTAVFLSLGCTFVPLGLARVLTGEYDRRWRWKEFAGATLAGGGLAFGPGAGHLYAGNTAAFWRGVGIRAAGVGLFAWGLAELEDATDWDESGAGLGLTLAGGTLVVGGMVLDFFSVHQSVRTHNRRVQPLWSRLQPTVQVAPGRLALGLTAVF